MVVLIFAVIQFDVAGRFPKSNLRDGHVFIKPYRHGGIEMESNVAFAADIKQARGDMDKKPEPCNA